MINQSSKQMTNKNHQYKYMSLLQLYPTHQHKQLLDSLNHQEPLAVRKHRNNQSLVYSMLETVNHQEP